MADEQDEKTEQATDARREDFRRRGQVAQTKELASCMLLLASAGGVYVLSRFFFQNIYELFSYTFGSHLVTTIRSGDFSEAMLFCATKGLILIAPVLAIAGLVAGISSVVQVGFLQVEDALSPDFNKLNPAEGLKRILSLRALAEGIKSFLKLVFIATILYLLLKSEVAKVPYLIGYSLEGIFQYIGAVVVKLLGGIGMMMLILSGADYFFQRWDLEKKMMMTKQEVKEEAKSREGDPMIKARIRRMQRERASKRMMEAIPKADVVITNPTHIAVVLKYDASLPSPQIVAKGADLIAEKIKAIAREHNIPIVENKPLARTIFKTLKIGQVIPRELFVAVAEVLSYVYKLRKKVRR
ncbi:MAG: flagellar biosynthesis protein FlhB [Bdellovibrionaceae bacterium]|nr:flagellar biosynthesis protein FlhB [Pseudobdellovibrionaceae bacterium]